MKQFIATAAVFAAAITGATADLCADGSVNDGGNWYCQKVSAITYTGVGGSGSYNKVTQMDGTAGTCSSSPHGYSGSLSPLNEEVSLHFRGPLKIKQFAAYSPSSSSSSKKVRRSAHERRHAHGHAHFHQHQKEVREAQENAEVEKRAVGDWVVATIGGQVVSWKNDFGGDASPATSVAAAATSVAAAATSLSVAIKQVVKATSAVASSAPSSTAAASAAASSSSSSSSNSGSGWSQVAYYNAASGTANGVTFLNHNGGSGSGVFDYQFGNSLSYASADGCNGASSPQVLDDITIPSNEEVIIMSDKECTGDSCGYVRPGSVAYHGFGGDSKVFFFEFQMPLDGKTDAYSNGDMPAIWMLNSQIPRTLQYGKAECSCWTTGCGEFDVFEVLAPGDLRCKSTLHGNISGGNSDYFARPTTGTIKAVLVMNENNIHIKVIDNDFDFSSFLDASVISDICESTMTQIPNLVSLFTLSS